MADPVAIEIRHLDKAFERPGRAPLPPGRRVRHPLRRGERRRLHVLEDISFDVHRGEFFGIVGRNGSGKSTLLKMLASIYRADRGTIRVGGRLAPFIELGVGFNPNLSARDNVVLNGVMMGLTPEVARRRFDEIVEFGGLEDFTDLKLKNYSSGMKVRLGFSVMVHVDADVLLIDEVLAVGDKAFRDKCGEVFVRMHEEGKTIVLVSHDMRSINTYCDRAMLVHDGRIERIGDPEEVANRYLELNALRKLGKTAGASESLDEEPLERARAQIVDLGIRDATASEPVVGDREPIEFEAVVEIRDEIVRPTFRFRIQEPSGRQMFVAPARDLAESTGSAMPCDRLRIRATIENRLPAGPYVLMCRVSEQDGEGEDVPVSPARWVNFNVASDEPLDGLVSLEHEVWVEPAVETEASKL